MRKNKKWIISVVTVVVILLSCTMLVAFTSADKDVQYIRTNYVSEMNGQTLVIESREELDQYFNTNKEKYNLGHKEKVYSDTTIGFEDAIVDYDEEWFKDHNIVLVLLTANSGSIRYKANNINIKYVIEQTISIISSYFFFLILLSIQFMFAPSFALLS